MPGRRHRRIRLIWLTLFALLFQQFALAVHACEQAEPMSPAASEASGHAEHCESIPLEPAASDPVCAKHCLPDQATATDQAIAKLPPMALPSASQAWPAAFAGSVQCPPPPPRNAVDPPATLRFCTLQI